MDERGARRALTAVAGVARSSAVARGPVRGERCEAKSEQRHGSVDRRCGVRPDGHVIEAQQVEAGQDAPRHRARNIGAVQQSQPRDPPGRRLRPSGDGGKRGAHQQRRRQQAHRHDHAARHHPGEARRRLGEVEAPDPRHDVQHQDSGRRDPQFETGEHLDGMPAHGHESWQGEAAQAQSRHVGRQQQPQRDGRGADHQLQQLEPHDFVDQGRAAAAGQQQQQEGQNRGRRSPGLDPGSLGVEGRRPLL